MRVGTKLLLLALLPVCCVVVLAVVASVSTYRTADRLSRYRDKARLSFALAPVAVDLAHERRAAVLARLDPGAPAQARLAAFESMTTRAFEQARARAVHVGASIDVVGALDAARRQRQALVLQLDADSLGPGQAIAGYSVITQEVLNLVATLDAGAPSPSSARAAAAYEPVLQAIETASRERVFVATLLAPRGPPLQPAASPWPTLEAAELNEFRQNAAGPLAADLEAVLFSPAGVAVQHFRDQFAANPSAAIHGISLPEWLSISERRITALRGVAAAAGGSLVAVVSNQLSSAHASAVRDLVLSFVALALVSALALALRRSIARPLRDVSVAAGGLARGDIAAGVEYSSRDEIGGVAAAFRDVHATAERLVDEIRAENRAVRENRLEHRADVSGLDGVWSQLVAGMNETMGSFAELQERREHAERETGRIFEMSPDLLCVIGFDGYFKRINPAFERMLGYSREALLSRRGFDFTHPDDLERSTEVFSGLRRGEQVEQFENRNVCADGSVRWLAWSARSVPEEGVVYAVGRDITERRRAAEEQVARRRVATLVARAASPDQVFSAVAEEAGKLLAADIALIGRYGTGPSVTAIVAWRADGGENPAPLGRDVPLGDENIMSRVFADGGPVRIEAYSKASGALGAMGRATGVRSAVGVPITVEGHIWGVVMIGLEREGSWPPNTEEQLANFTDLAATAIANADAREELRDFAKQQEALRRVATLVAGGAAAEVAFAAVAEEVANVLPDVDLALVGRYTPDKTIEFVGGWSSLDKTEWVGRTVPLGGHNASTAVFETAQPARVDQLEDDATALTAIARGTGTRSSAGAPIKVEGRLWGVMIVASSREEGLRVGVEGELAGFTELVATAIANADGRAQLRLVADEQAALRRVATLIAHGSSPEEVFTKVAAEVGQLLEAEIVVIHRFDQSGYGTVVASWGQGTEVFPVGRRSSLEGRSATALVYRTHRPARLDSYAGATEYLAVAARKLGLSAGVASPIIVEGRLWGAIVAAKVDTKPLPVGFEERVAAFTELVATAIANAEGREQLVSARRRVIEATDAARAKLSRDIHDGAQQQFLTALIDLQLAQRKRASDVARSVELVDLAAAQVETGVETLRELAAGVHPGILSDLGLKAALEQLAARMPLPLTVEIDDLALPPAVEATVYFFCSEALTNVVKHAAASAAWVRIQAASGHLSVEVHDDGVGGAESGAGGTGLMGLQDRIGALEGSLSVNSPHDGTGTTLLARIPLPD